MKVDKPRPSLRQKQRSMSADSAEKLSFAGLVDAIAGRIRIAHLADHRNLLRVAVIYHGINRQIAQSLRIGQLHPLERLGLVHLTGEDVAVAELGVGDPHRLVDKPVQFLGRRLIADVGGG